MTALQPAGCRLCCARRALAPRRIGGCDFAEDPDTPAEHARLFWRDDTQPAQLTIDATPVGRSDPNAIDFCSLHQTRRVLVDEDGGEHWMIREGSTEIALRVRSGTLLEGPVRLSYALGALTRLDAQLGTLRALLALVRDGRLPQERGRGNRSTAKLLDMIRSLDALSEGASARDVAVLLFGEAAVRRGWADSSDFLRSRVRRLIRDARAIRDGGYRTLLL